MGDFHVVLHVDDGVHLVFGLVELEAVFELALPFAVGREGVALGGLAHGVKLQQLLGHVFHGLLHARFGLLPLLRAQPIQYRLHALGRAILLHQIQAGQRYVKSRALGILQDHELGSCRRLPAEFLSVPGTGRCRARRAPRSRRWRDRESRREMPRPSTSACCGRPSETSASSNRSRAPNRTRFASGSATPSGTYALTMVVAAISSAK